MEKIKIVIKGKHDDAGYTDFHVKTKGDLNIIANGLAMVLCDICIDNGTSSKDVVKFTKEIYSKCMKEREEQE